VDFTLLHIHFTRFSGNCQTPSPTNNLLWTHPTFERQPIDSRAIQEYNKPGTSSER